MEKLEKLEFYRTQLKLLADFMECYLPLANAHTVDFLVDDMWMSDVPELIRTQLLCLKPHELVTLPEKSPECSEDVEHLGSQISQDDDSHQPPAAANCDNINRPKLNRRLKCSWRHTTLKHFVEAAHMHTLKNLDVLSAKDNLPMEQGKSFHMRDFMCAKKAHEVEVMAALCSSLCDKHNVDQVVDIGSGLGYLSGHLAFLHNLKVLGIDSSNTNTHGADKRSARLTKHWPLLLANAQLSQLGLPPVRTKGKNKLKNQKKSADSGHSENLDDVKPEDYIPPEKFEALATKLKAAKQLSPKGCFEPITMYVTEETDLVALMKEHFKDSSIQPSSECATRENALGCNSDKISSNSETFVLTGLHTCGGLASSILRLFLSNSNAVCVCNVGCCYHLLDEEFVRGPFEKDDDPVPSEFGFPLSECLLNRNFHLGRNARMLACQAPARLADATEGQERMGPERSLHWRAVLQVILCDVTEERRDDWNIGRLASKCSGFVEYVTKALKKLNIIHNLTDSDITAYEKKFVESEKHMKCFFYLRATLAACIESLILLDRLVYLLEQDCVTDACLVELFDPKLSPRCWAVIASK